MADKGHKLEDVAERDTTELMMGVPRRPGFFRVIFRERERERAQKPEERGGQQGQQERTLHDARLSTTCKIIEL